MNAAEVSYPPAHAGPSLFATSLGASVIVHCLIFAWMLSGSGPPRALLTDLPAFHSVSLVDAPGSAPPAEAEANVPEPEPQAIPEAVAVPAAVNPATVRDVAPETVVRPPRATRPTEVSDASVEPPAPAASPKPVAVPERPAAATTPAQQPRPARATEARPAPAPTPTLAGVAAAQTETATPPPAAAQPRAPASRNSPQAAARAREAIENLRARTGAEPSPEGAQPGLQDVLMRTYERRVRAKIIQALHLPMTQDRAQKLKAIALLAIDREGQVIRYELTTPSGNASFDASVHRAVQASSPLPPLPETYSGEILEAEIHFTPPASS